MQATKRDSSKSGGHMVTMSLGVELALFADQVPFIAARSHRRLAEIKEGSPMPEAIADVWTALALLIERHNDRTIRVVMRSNCTKNRHGVAIVRVGVYSSGYTREEWTCDHDFPLAAAVLLELVNSGYVRGIPRSGYTDDTELVMTEYGERALVDQLKRAV